MRDRERLYEPQSFEIRLDQGDAIWDAAEILEGLDHIIDRPSLRRTARFLRSILDEEVRAEIYGRPEHKNGEGRDG